LSITRSAPREARSPNPHYSVDVPRFKAARALQRAGGAPSPKNELDRRTSRRHLHRRRRTREHLPARFPRLPNLVARLLLRQSLRSSARQVLDVGAASARWATRACRSRSQGQDHSLLHQTDLSPYHLSEASAPAGSEIGSADGRTVTRWRRRADAARPSEYMPSRAANARGSTQDGGRMSTSASAAQPTAVDRAARVNAARDGCFAAAPHIFRSRCGITCVDLATRAFGDTAYQTFVQRVLENPRTLGVCPVTPR